MRVEILVLVTGKDQAGVHPEPLKMMMLYLYLNIFERDMLVFSTISKYAVFIPRNIVLVNITRGTRLYNGLDCLIFCKSCKYTKNIRTIL